MSPGAFTRKQIHGLPFYCCSAFERIPGVRHGFSTRHGGVGKNGMDSLNLTAMPWDAPARVAANRARFAQAVGLGAGRLVTVAQIHSDRVHLVEEPGQPGRIEADSLVTARRDVALGVQVADCLPVLIADRAGKAVAAVHSGWRGTAARVVARAAEALTAASGCSASDLLIAIGPGIRSCCFEVGPEVVDAFRRSYPGHQLWQEKPGAPGKALLDPVAAIRVQAAELGIAQGQVFDSGACTICQPEEFFSYRVEGLQAGRMMALIGLLP